METLIIRVTTLHGIFLMDSQNNLLGRFPTVEDAEQWCRENGYRSRVQKP